MGVFTCPPSFSASPTGRNKNDINDECHEFQRGLSTMNSKTQKPGPRYSADKQLGSDSPRHSAHAASTRFISSAARVNMRRFPDQVHSPISHRPSKPAQLPSSPPCSCSVPSSGDRKCQAPSPAGSPSKNRSRLVGWVDSSISFPNIAPRVINTRNPRNPKPPNKTQFPIRRLYWCRLQPSWSPLSSTAFPMAADASDGAFLAYHEPSSEPFLL